MKCDVCGKTLNKNNMYESEYSGKWKCQPCKTYEKLVIIEEKIDVLLGIEEESKLELLK